MAYEIKSDQPAPDEPLIYVAYRDRPDLDEARQGDPVVLRYSDGCLRGKIVSIDRFGATSRATTGMDGRFVVELPG